MVFVKRAVAIVYVEMVVGEEVVGCIYVGPAVAVNVVYYNAQSPSFGEYAGFFGYICKMRQAVYPTVIAKELVHTFAGAIGALANGCVAGIGFEGVGKEVHIQVAIGIIIKEGCLGRIAMVCQTCAGGYFFKHGHAVGIGAEVMK